MNWLKRLLGQNEPERVTADEPELQQARVRRRQLMEKMIALGTEAEVFVSREERDRKHAH